METPAEEIGNGPAQGNAPELRLTGCQFEKVIVQGQRRPHTTTMLTEVFDVNKVNQTSINPNGCQIIRIGAFSTFLPSSKEGAGPFGSGPKGAPFPGSKVSKVRTPLPNSTESFGISKAMGLVLQAGGFRRDH
jgi:hypothetical protein